MYKEGLVRFCTAPYCKPTSKNLACAYMHLTNYAVNKHNTDAFVAPGSKLPGSSSCAADSSSGDEAEADQAPAQQQQQQQRMVGGPAGAGGEWASKWSFSQLRQHLESQGGQQQHHHSASTHLDGSYPQGACLVHKNSQRHSFVYQQLQETVPAFSLAPACMRATVLCLCCAAAGHSWSGVWSSISQLVVKSLAAATPHLAATYRTTVVSNGSSATASRPGGTAHGSSSCGSPRGSSSAPAAASSAAVAAGCCRCFEVLGYDVMLDAALKPWLVEVNHSPSFNIDSPLDRSIKEALIVDAVRLVRHSF
jgi:hypothetical protein